MNTTVEYYILGIPTIVKSIFKILAVMLLFAMAASVA